jgi:CRP-like cAMP-binding protein/ATP/ADP translocase
VNRLRKLSNLQPGEGRPVLFLFIYFFSFVAINISGKTARDTYFLSQYDRRFLPLMFIAVAVAVALAVALYSRLTRNVSLKRAIPVTGGVFAVSLGLFQGRITGLAIPLLYIWMDVITTIVVFQLWSLAGEIFDPRQAKRVFGLLGAGGSLAAVIIGFGIRPFVRLVGVDYLLPVTIVFLAVGVLAAHRAGRYAGAPKIPQSPLPTTPTGRQPFDPYLLTIALVIALSAITSTLADYQFKMTASTTYPQADRLAGFFGLYYAVTGAASLLIQLFVTSRLLARYGILTGLLLLPGALFLGFTAFLLRPVLTSAFISKFSDQTFKFTINSTVTQLLWLPVPPGKKRRAKPFIDGTIKTSAEGLAGLTVFLLVKFIAIQYLSLLALASLMAWIAAAFRLRAGYVTALQQAIEKRQLNFTELELDVTDQAVISTIAQALESGEEGQQLFALELIEELPLEPWRDTANRLFHHGTPLVREKILTLAATEPSVISDAEVLALLRTETELTPLAMHVAGRRRLTDAVPLLADYLENTDPRFSAAAAAALLTLGTGPADAARTHLQTLLEGDDTAAAALALRHLGDNPEILSTAELAKFLEHPSPQIREAVLHLARRRRESKLLPGIVRNLEYPTTALLARAVLQEFPSAQVLPVLQTATRRDDRSREYTRGLLRTLKTYDPPEAPHLILDLIEWENPSLAREGVEALLAIARRTPLPPPILESLDQKTTALAHRIYTQYQVLHLLSPFPAHRTLLLRDDLHHQIHSLLPVLLILGVLDRPHIPIETYIHYLLTGDARNLPFVLELLENIYSREERSLVTPLIDDRPLAERCQAGAQLFPDLPADLDAALVRFLESPRPWLRALALDFVLAEQRKPVWRRLQPNTLLKNSLTQELLAFAWRQEHPFLRRFPLDRSKFASIDHAMYSTLEKTIRLKGVDLFKSIPGEELSRVAQIAEEIQLPAGTPIFKTGDYGDSMYIVLDGRVRIHRGEREIALLGRGDCLGEMALLDQEPRSADATVQEEAILLKITQEGFYELMSSNMEIMQGIVKLLTGRLRKAIT